MEDTLSGLPRYREAHGWNDKPSRAIIACHYGRGIVLSWVGWHIDCEIKNVGLDIEDLGLVDAPNGLSIWEGVYDPNFVSMGPEDDDSPELKGTFRPLNDDEWNALRENRRPWNDSEWRVNK